MMEYRKELFTAPAQSAIAIAQRTARYGHQGRVGTEHLLVGLLSAEDGAASVLLADAGVDPVRLASMIDRLITTQGGESEDMSLSARASAVLDGAARLAAELSDEKAGTEHLLLAMLGDTASVATRLLHTMGTDLRKLAAAAIESIGAQDRLSAEDLFGKNREDGSRTPNLDQFSRDLTALAAEGKLDPVVGRETEMNRVIRILSRRSKNNPCLIGEPGVGKTAIVEGLAGRIAEGLVPDAVAGKRLLRLDLSGMVAGTKYRGEFEERIKSVVEEASRDGSVILFIDELHTLIGAGGAEGALDAANILKPALSRGEIRVIGATTIEEYRKYVEKDAALERRFQPVTVEEPTEEETAAILTGLRPYYEKHHGIKIGDDAIAAAVRLSARYISDRRLPDKALDLIDEAAAGLLVGDTKQTGKIFALEQQIRAMADEKEEAIAAGDLALAGELLKRQEALEKECSKLRSAGAGRKAARRLGEEDVSKVAAEMTGIPVTRLREKESQRLSRLETEIHKRIIGQDEAVGIVARAVRRGRVGLKDPRRPTGSFLFLGPTGVGKTELAKVLAETVYGSQQAMIRVDMSEYMEKYSVSKLIGSPPGYVGYEEGGQLSEQVRRHPYSVLLFDEIEKAHPDVFNILLQVLDEGHITDAHGRKVDFKNTLIIMSSNAGAQRVVEPKHLGFSSGDTAQKEYEKMKSGVLEEVRKMFRPEFLNRIDAVIVFRQLTREEVRKIVRLLFSDLKKRAADEMGIRLVLAPSAAERIAEKGFSEKYGARPLRRMIQDRIEDELASKILRGEIREGDTVRITADKDGGFRFVKGSGKGKKAADGERQ